MTSAVSQHEGMPKNICVLHASTLKQAKYYLKVMFDISDDYYQHGTLTPIYGNGQGSTNSSTAWLNISNYMLKCHRQQANGANYLDPTRTYQTRIFIVSFVDDMNLFSNMFETNHPENFARILLKLQQDTQ